jgi:Concanavalin A-like lectin/glucanases superfamily
MGIKRFLCAAIAMLAFAAAASSADADTSVVGQWALNEGSGTVAADSSGNADNGTILGGATWVPTGSDSALSFNGATAAVQIPDSAALEPSAAVTVSAWVEQAGIPGDYRYILAKGENGCSTASYGLYTGASGGLVFYVSNGRGNAYVSSPDAGSTVWNGAWHLVVGTFDGGTVRLYVDGSEAGSGTPHSGQIDYGLSDSNDLFIGNYPAAQTYGSCHAGGFLGLIGEVTIWNRALSASEVSALTSPPAGATSPAGPDPGPTGTSGSPPTPGSGGPQTHAPEIDSFKFSLSATSAVGRLGRAARGATISYTLSQAAHMTFRVELARAGVLEHGRCAQAVKGERSEHVQHCVRLDTLARFAQAGKAGVNRLHFGGRAWSRLRPNRYRLEATPSAHGQTGKTVSTAFTISG